MERLGLERVNYICVKGSANMVVSIDVNVSVGTVQIHWLVANLNPTYIPKIQNNF